MSEKLLRLERLIAVLDVRQIEPKDRSKYLFEQVGDARISQWSDLLSGKKSFGDKLARRIEEKLGLVRGSLEEHGLPPDVASVAGAFAALPANTPEQLEVRQRLYVAIMAMLGPHVPAEPSSPAPAPAQPPSAGPAPRK